MYTQKTSQTSLTPAHAEEKLRMAEEDIPLSVKTLQSEPQAYREGMMNDIKTQIENMHHDIWKDISLLREEAKVDINTLRGELSQKIEALHKIHTETADTQKEMERSLCDAFDRITAVEKAHKTLNKDCNKLQEKCMDLENRSRRQSLCIVGINKDMEVGNLSCFVVEFFTEVLGEENFESPIIIDRGHRTLAWNHGKENAHEL